MKVLIDKGILHKHFLLGDFYLRVIFLEEKLENVTIIISFIPQRDKYYNYVQLK